jgi:hypothetical protein
MTFPAIHCDKSQVMQFGFLNPFISLDTFQVGGSPYFGLYF